MDFYCVIDTSAFIWDEEKFKKDSSPYFQLASDLMEFIEVIEKERPQLLMRSQLIIEMMSAFPYTLIQGKVNFRDLAKSVNSFLAKCIAGAIQFTEFELPGIVSQPDIVYNYYNGNVKKETVYLISYIHQENTNSIYFTFKAIWGTEDDLKTSVKANVKSHETIISSTAELEQFFEQFRIKFEHNRKHDKLKGHRVENGEEIWPLSCDNGTIDDNPYAQMLLDTSVTSSVTGHRYNYDDLNRTYVRFFEHNPNRFHAFDDPNKKVPFDIRSHFHK